VLAIADWARTTIKADEDTAALIRAALDLAWRWLQAADVSGLELYETVAGDSQALDDDGIQEYMVAEDQQFTLVTITSAIIYTSWHAYVAAGEKRRPEPICEAGDEDIDITVGFAKQMPIGFNQAAVDRLAQYCINYHKAADANTLGEPISRETMMQVADWASA